jgi:hypothetical protein
LIALISILRSEADKSVRQAAAIYFKNRVQQGWDPSKKTGIPDHEKAVVRDNILPAIMDVIDIPNIR